VSPYSDLIHKAVANPYYSEMYLYVNTLKKQSSDCLAESKVFMGQAY